MTEAGARQRWAAYRGLVCDLDGVVYRGRGAIPGAPEALTAWCSSGRRVVYATNNASRPPQTVADHLRSLGAPAAVEQVLTSAQVGADHLARVLPAGAAVLAVGGPGVAVALSEVGLRPVTGSGAEVVAVLQGYGPDVRARDLNEAAFAVQAGAAWVATNTDRTIPTGRGTGPGNGMLVAAVEEATGVTPTVVGKPEPAMALSSAERMGLPVEGCLAVGDRLDTDILGGQRAGMDTLWVFSGVHGLVDLLRCAEATPTWVAPSLAGLPGLAGREDLVDPPAGGISEVRAEDGGRFTLGSVRVDLRGAMPTVEGWAPGRPGHSLALAAATAAVLHLSGRAGTPGTVREGRDARALHVARTLDELLRPVP